MNNSSKIARIIVGVIGAILLIGSFPVRHYYGQPSCDVVRIIGFVLLIIYLIMKLWANKK